jgi:hypothetical protein
MRAHVFVKIPLPNGKLCKSVEYVYGVYKAFK